MPSFQVDGLHVEHATAQAALAAKGRPAARPALLLVHGAAHGAWCWENWMEALARRGWESYALSLRNHPGSRAVPEAQYLRGTHVDDYADDVETVARYLSAQTADLAARTADRAGRAEAQRLVVAGHSMGGIVVQRFVARQGEAGVPVAGMILVASVAPAPSGPMRDGPLSEEHGFTLAAEDARARFFHAAPRSVTDAAIARLVPESPSVMNEYSLGPGIAIPPGRVRCPVLVLTAEHDGTNVPRDRRSADFYGGDYVLCKGIGHDLMLDAGWEGPLDTVAAWLERHWPA